MFSWKDAKILMKYVDDNPEWKIFKQENVLWEKKINKPSH